jgi:hypothetical protein
MVTTSRPLEARIMLMVIVASLDFTALLLAEVGRRQRKVVSLKANAPAQGWLHACNAQMSLELA